MKRDHHMSPGDPALREEASAPNAPIKGITAYAALSDLDPALVSEAEVDEAFLPATVTRRRKSRRAAHRTAAHVARCAERGEGEHIERREGLFVRFARSGWGVATISLAVAFLVLGAIVYMGNRSPGVGPGSDPVDSGNSSLGSLDAAEMLLPGTIPFAPAAADFTISVDPAATLTDTGFSVEAVARELGTGLFMAYDWKLEKLSGEPWAGGLITEDLAYEALPVEGERATHTQAIGLTAPLTPGLYRLHAMEHDGTEFRSVAYCEFAVDDERGYYKTFTLADFEDAMENGADYTLSTSPRIPYGSSAVTVTFTAKKPMTSLMGPNTCRLVKLDGTAGAGACFAIKVYTNFAVEIDGAPGSNAVATQVQTYTILNPAACTPGKYRIYNVDDRGNIWATCDFEIVGTPLGWPGDSKTDTVPEETHPYPEAAEKPFTIKASVGITENGKMGYFSITYRGRVQGQSIVNPPLGFRIVKLYGDYEPSWELIGTADGIESVMPTEKHDNYAVFYRSYTISDPTTIHPGAYRVYALNGKGEWIDYYDMVYGDFDHFPKAAEQPYTLEAEICPPKYEGAIHPEWIYLYMTYRGTEKGELIHPLITDFRICKLFGEPDEREPLIQLNEYGLEPEAPGPNAYCVLSDSRRIDNPEDMKPGIYRVYTLNRKGEYIDYCDVTWNGYIDLETETDAPSPDGTDVRETPTEPGADYSISVADVYLPLRESATLTVTYRATRPGKSFSMGGIRIVCLDTGREIELDFPDDDCLVAPDDPTEYLVYDRDYFIIDPAALTSGRYRATAYKRDTATATAEFCVYAEGEKTAASPS